LVPVQLPSHLLLAVALHDASHWLLLASELHCAVQSASRLASHSPWQLKLGGSALQCAWHVVTSHDAVHVASAVAVHCPLQLTSSFPAQAASIEMGVHMAVQPPDVSTVQVSSARTSIFPHAPMPADAFAVTNVGRAKAAGTKKAMPNRRLIVDSSGRACRPKWKWRRGAAIPSILPRAGAILPV
jgi:hypothetical protein